jgi:hypothetical protein
MISPETCGKAAMILKVESGPATPVTRGFMPDQPPVLAAGAGHNLRSSPLELCEYARVTLIEEIMAIQGRAMPKPRVFRSFLEGSSTAELSAHLHFLLTAMDDGMVPEENSGRVHEAVNGPITPLHRSATS